MILNTIAVDSRARAAVRLAEDCGIDTDYLALRAAGNQAVASILTENPTLTDTAQLQYARAGMAWHLVQTQFGDKAEELQVGLAAHLSSGIEAYFNA